MDNIKWNMTVELYYEVCEDEETGLYGISNGSLYVDYNYGYYERRIYVRI